MWKKNANELQYFFTTFRCFSTKFKEISSGTIFHTKFDEFWSIVLIKTTNGAVFHKTAQQFARNIIESSKLSIERLQSKMKSHTKICFTNNVWNRSESAFVLKSSFILQRIHDSFLCSQCDVNSRVNMETLFISIHWKTDLHLLLSNYAHCIKLLVYLN